MRDAFGSTFMFKLIVIFIVLYVTFATIAVSYAKTFRLKNRVVDIVEQNQLVYESNRSWRIIEEKIDNYLDSSNYHHNTLRIKNVCTDDGNNDAWFSSNGACVLPVTYEVNGSTHYYFLVTLYMVIHIPGINYDALIPISGETEDFNYNYNID